MKLTVLTDNAARIDVYCLAEPGVCYAVEDGGRHILFDTGYSDVYVRNAETLGLDLARTDAVVLSHGHDDHTGGLAALPRTRTRPALYACPDVFAPRREGGVPIGSPLTREQAAERFDLRLSREPVWLTERLVFLGAIPRVWEFEPPEPVGEVFLEGVWQPDTVADDSALAYRGRDGLTVVTGCSHAGVCNVVEHAKRVCGEERVAGVIGGFHLMTASPRARRTAEYLAQYRGAKLRPSHCTCFAARAAIHRLAPVEEVCVGDVLDIP